MSEEQNTQKEELQTVEVVRAVRFGRLMMVGAVLGGVLAVVMTLTRPVVEGAFYEMAQIAGFMFVVGAALGMAAGGILGLLLNISAKKKHGRATAKHIDVQ